MSRIDVTKQKKFSTFRELIPALEGAGIEIDHFHAVDLVEIKPDYMNHDEMLIMKADGEIVRVEKRLVHLNLGWEGGILVDAAWSEGDWEGNPLGSDPRGFHSLVADEWHER